MSTLVSNLDEVEFILAGGDSMIMYENDEIHLAIQVVDGTKVAANATGNQTCDLARLEKLLARTEDAISELEAQNISGDEPSPSHLPAELQQAQVLRERIQHAISRLARDHHITRVNLTDQDAQLMKGRQGDHAWL